MPHARTIARMLAGVVIATGAAARQGDGTDVAITAHVYKPAKVAADGGWLE
jgi:hypothetical protein